MTPDNELKILHLEDMSTDAELIHRVLQKSSLRFDIQHVDNRSSFIAALSDNPPDLILSDHSLPSFNSTEALRILKEKGIKIPFILITSTISEEFAVEVMKEGAWDYILKDRLQRLPSAIENVMLRYRHDNERKQILDQVIASDALHKEAELIARFGTWRSDLRTGKTVMSDGAYRIIGYEPDEINPDENFFISNVHPDDLLQVQKLISEAIQGSAATSMDFRVTGKDGRIRHIHSEFQIKWDENGTPVSLIGFNQDITRQKEAEARLIQSETQYRHLFENNPMPMWVVDTADFRYLDVNAASIAHYGYSREEFLSMTALDLRPGDEHERFLAEEGGPVLHSPNRGIWKHITKDGALIYVEIFVHPIEYNGKAARLVLSNDITERKKAEEQIMLLTHTLENKVRERTAQLEQSMKELESFSYSVSHDLRAPLRVINGFAKLFIEDYTGKVDNDAIEYINTINDNATQMGQLIEDLLNLSRLGLEAFEKTEVDMRQIVEVTLYEYKMNHGNISAEITIDELPAAQCSRNLLKQVWVNLIVNAIKYSGKKPDPSIHIGSYMTEGEIIYFIKDNGAGFDMKYADRLFGVFQRLHSKQDFDGTGVGLALVHRIITRHGGKVWAEGKVGQGATFYFSLPR